MEIDGSIGCLNYLTHQALSGTLLEVASERLDTKSRLEAGPLLVPRPIEPMRVPDFVLKSSAFVVSIATPESLDQYDLEGTGFLIGLPCTRAKGNHFFYFVTAAHVVANNNVQYGIRVNLKQGGTEIVPVDRWYRHPSDKHAEVAVTPFRNKYHEYDILFLGEDTFRSREAMQEQDIGIGDEVHFPGLFTLAQLESDHQNLPILRMGNITMLPPFPVPTEAGPMEAYLIEARSIGGISGSPVFCRRTMSVLWNDEGIFQGKPVKAMHGMTGDHNLIGMIYGHWDVNETEINQARFTRTQEAQGVNVGIAIVVPLHKIIETINQEELVDRRKQVEDDWMRKFEAKAD